MENIKEEAEVDPIEEEVVEVEIKKEKGIEAEIEEEEKDGKKKEIKLCLKKLLKKQGDRPWKHKEMIVQF